MRADRLIALLMLLQTHEIMTSGEIAKELEVTQRTIHRDVTALNIAGVPIYTVRGPGGGIALLESYRTSLMGINEDEARALFMLSIPEPLVELGIGQKLKSALLKLAVALPASQRRLSVNAQQRIYLDSTPWTAHKPATPHLGILHQAVWEDRMVRIRYQGSFEAEIEIELAPLGLVAKMRTWYLVGKDNGYMRVINIANILQVTPMDRGFAREEDFDLQAFWKGWCKATQARRYVYRVKLEIAPELALKLHQYLGDEVEYTFIENEPGDENGWRDVTIFYDNFFQARESILSFGNAAEVLEPVALKLSVIDFAKQIIGFYQARS